MATKLKARLSLVVLAIIFVLAFGLVIAATPAATSAQAFIINDDWDSDTPNDYAWVTDEIDILGTKVWIEAECNAIQYDFYHNDPFVFEAGDPIDVSIKVWNDASGRDPEPLGNAGNCVWDGDNSNVNNAITVHFGYWAGHSWAFWDDPLEGEPTKPGNYTLVPYIGTYGEEGFLPLCPIYISIQKQVGPVTIKESLDFNWGLYTAQGLISGFYTTNDWGFARYDDDFKNDDGTMDVTLYNYDEDAPLHCGTRVDGRYYDSGESSYAFYEEFSDVSLPIGKYVVVFNWTGASLYSAGSGSMELNINPIALISSYANDHFTKEWACWTVSYPSAGGMIDATVTWKYLEGEYAAGSMDGLTLPTGDDRQNLAPGVYTLWPELTGSDADKCEMQFSYKGGFITIDNPAVLTVTKVDAGVKDYLASDFEGVVYNEEGTFGFYGNIANEWFDNRKPTGVGFIDAYVTWFYDDDETGLPVPVTPSTMNAGTYDIYFEITGSDAEYFDYTVTLPGGESTETLVVNKKTLTDVYLYINDFNLTVYDSDLDEATTNILYFDPDGLNITAKSTSVLDLEITIEGWKKDLDDDDEIPETRLGDKLDTYYSMSLMTPNQNYAIAQNNSYKVTVAEREIYFYSNDTAGYTGTTAKPSFSWMVKDSTTNPNETAVEFGNNHDLWDAVSEIDEQTTDAVEWGVAISDSPIYHYGVELNTGFRFEDTYSISKVWDYAIVAGYANVAFEQVAPWRYYETVTDLSEKLTVTVTTNTQEDAPQDDLVTDEETPISGDYTIEWSPDCYSWTIGLPNNTAVPDPGESLYIRITTKESKNKQFLETTAIYTFMIQKAPIYAVLDKVGDYLVSGTGAQVGPECYIDEGKDVSFHLFSADGPIVYDAIPETFDPDGDYDVDNYNYFLRNNFVSTFTHEDTAYQTLYIGDFSYYYELKTYKTDPLDSAKTLGDRFVMNAETATINWTCDWGVVTTEKLDMPVSNFTYGGSTGSETYVMPNLNFTGKKGVWVEDPGYWSDAAATDDILGTVSGFDAYPVAYKIPYEVVWEYNNVSSTYEGEWTTWAPDTVLPVGEYWVRATAYFANTSGITYDWHDDGKYYTLHEGTTFNLNAKTFKAVTPVGYFTVDAKVINLVWSNTSHTYDATSHGASVALSVESSLCYDEQFADVITYTTTEYTDYKEGGWDLTATVNDNALGNKNYTIGLGAATKYIVNKKTLTVTPVNYDRYYGDAAPDYGYTITGIPDAVDGEDQGEKLSNLRWHGLISSYDKYPEFSCDYDTEVAANRKADTYTISISGIGDLTCSDNYQFDITSTGTLTVSPKAITVTVTDKSVTYGESFAGYNPSDTGVAYGDENVYTLRVYTVEAGEKHLATIDSTAHVGTYYIIGTLNNVNYAVTWNMAHEVTVDEAEVKAATYVINTAALTVTPDGGQTKGKGEIDPTFTYTVTGAKNGETPVFTGALSRVEGEEKGEYNILIGDLALTDAEVNENYHVVFTSNVKFGVGMGTIDMSSISFFGDYNPYSGDARSLAITGNLGALPGGVSVAYYLTDSEHTATNELFGTRTHVGTYYVEARFSVEDDEYTTPASMYAVLQIQQREVSVVWTFAEGGYRYTGEDQAYQFASASYTLSDGESTVYNIPMHVIITTAQDSFKNVGSYGLQAISDDTYGDYALTGITAGVQMQKKLLTVTWQSENEYTGASNNPQVVSIVGNVDGEKVGAECDQNVIGIQAWTTLTFSLTGDDKDNYECLSYAIPTYNITRRTLAFTWEEKEGEYYEYVFDGEYHLPTVTIYNAVDGEEVGFTWNYGSRRNATTNSAQKVQMNLDNFTLTGKDAAHYRMPADAEGVTYAFMKILPLELEITWTNTVQTYAGTRLLPTPNITNLKTDNKKTPDDESDDKEDVVTVSFKSVNGGGPNPIYKNIYMLDHFDLVLGGDNASNYKIKDSEVVEFRINPAPLTITVNDIAAIKYGDAKPSFNYTLSGKQGDDTDGDAIEVADGTVFLCDYVAGTSGVGSYPVTINEDLFSSPHDNYALSFESKNLVVEPKHVTIQYLNGNGEHKTVVYGDEDSWDEMEWPYNYLTFEKVGEDSVEDLVKLVFRTKKGAEGYETLEIEELDYDTLVVDKYQMYVTDLGAEKHPNYVIDGFGVNEDYQAYLDVIPADLTVVLTVGDITYGEDFVEPTLESGIATSGWKTEAFDDDAALIGEDNLVIKYISVNNQVFGGKKYDAAGLQAGDHLRYSTWDDLTSLDGADAGEYYVFVQIKDLANYNWAFDVKIVTIGKKNLTVTADDKAVIYGDAVPTYTVSYEGFVLEEGENDLGGELAFGCSYSATSAVGSYDIVPSGYESNNYSFNYENGKVTVTPREVYVKYSGKHAEIVYGDKTAWASYMEAMADVNAFMSIVMTVENDEVDGLVGDDKLSDLVLIQLWDSDNEVVTLANTLGSGFYHWVAVNKANPNYVILNDIEEDQQVAVVEFNSDAEIYVAPAPIINKITIQKSTVYGTAYKAPVYGDGIVVDKDTWRFEGEEALLTAENAKDHIGVMYAPVAADATEEEIADLLEDPEAWSLDVPTLAGKYLIIIGIFGIDNYNNVYFNDSFVIENADLTDVSVAQVGTLTYNGKSQTATVNPSATAVNNQAWTFTYSLTENGVYTTAVPVLKNWAKNGYTVYYKVNAANHNEATGSFVVTINKKAVEITIDAKTSVYGDAQVALTATDVNKGIVDDDAYAAGKTPLPYTLACGVTATSAVGKYDITGSIANPNYDITFKNEADAYVVTNATLTAIKVTAATLTYDKTAQASVASAEATAVNDQKVTFTYATDKNGTYAATVPTFVNADNYTVYYKASAANHDEAAGEVKVTVAKKAITVTAEAKASDYKDDLVALTVAEDYLTVTNGNVYAIDGDLVATIATNAVNTKIGSDYAITVTVAGNDNYDVTVTNATYTVNAKITPAKPAEEGQEPSTEETTTQVEPISAEEIAEKTESGEGVSIKDQLDNVKAVIDAVPESKVESITFQLGAADEESETPVPTITFSLEAIKQLTENEDVKITYKETKAADVDKTDKALKNAVLVIEISLGGAKFDNGTATISTAFENKAPNGKKAVVYFVDDNGKKTDMKATFADGKVTFETTHFSTYVVEYVEVESGLSGGAIAGIVIGCVVGVAAIAVGVFFFLKKKGGKKAEASEENAEAKEEAKEESKEEAKEEAPAAEEAPAEGEDKKE